MSNAIGPKSNHVPLIRTSYPYLLSYLLSYLLYIFISLPIMANSGFSDSFGPKERKELEYLLSREYQKSMLYEVISKNAHKRSLLMTKLFLKEIAKTERFKREKFIKNNPWKKWEKREDYNMFQRWLQHISPIVKETPSTKDKP